MRIYTHEPLKTVRMQISQIGVKSEYLSLIDCDRDEVKSFLQELIEEQKISPFTAGSKTCIVIRNAVGGKNLASVSISFRGLSPKQTVCLIVNKLNPDQS